MCCVSVISDPSFSTPSPRVFRDSLCATSTHKIAANTTYNKPLGVENCEPFFGHIFPTYLHACIACFIFHLVKMKHVNLEIHNLSLVNITPILCCTCNMFSQGVGWWVLNFCEETKIPVLSRPTRFPLGLSDLSLLLIT